MTGWTRLTLIALGVAFAAAQFVRPDRTNPATDPGRTIQRALGAGTAGVKVIDRSCRDCHSHDTTWPWYSRVAPISWFVAHDVNEGRAAANFSEWGSYSAAKQRKLLAEACKEVSEGEMPGTAYTLIHADARLTQDDVRAICALTAVSSPAPVY